jgi:hypothetical protein
MDLGLRNKNMHAIKCNPIKLLFRWNALTWQVLNFLWKLGCYKTYALFTLLLPLHITYFLHLLSTNHKCTQPCYFPLLLRHAAQKEKMDWNSSTRGSRLRVAPITVLVVYGVFCFSFSLRVVLIFRDLIYVIIILYLWHLVICEHFWPYVWNNWYWDMHTMCTWFWHKNGVWHTTRLYRGYVNWV